MKLSQKRILTILAAAAMTCGTLPQSTDQPLLRPMLSANAEASVDDDFSYKENEAGGITIEGYTGSDDAVEIPAEINGKPVTEIGSWAFFNKQMSSILIPDSVTEIGSQAFNGCTKLKEIVLPGDITAIADGSFSGCSGLTKVIMPNGVTSIGANAFSGCTELKELRIPENVTQIGGSAFINTAWLKEKQNENPLVIVNHILVDGRTCKDDVAIPEDVTSICDLAFNGCRTMTSIFIPSGVESIGNDAFYNCSAMKSIGMQNGLKSIGGNAFYCTGLEEIRIPDTVTEIGSAAFFGCENLKYVHLPENLKELKSGRMGTFQGCTSIELIEIPESMTSIGTMTFATCTNLNRVIIHSSTTAIGANAFYGCASDLTLCGYAGSPAQTYASQNSLNFKELEAKFSDISLTLIDDLGLNFFAVGVTKENSENYHVVFSGKCEEAGQDIKFAEKNGKLCVTANVAATCMDEEITAELQWFNGDSWITVDTCKYSVNQYLKNTKPETDWSEAKSEAFDNLVETVKLYGEVSYAYFNNPENMPRVTDHKEDLLYGANDYNSYWKYNTATLEDNFDTQDTDLLSLTLNSRLSMRLYLDGMAEGDEAQIRDLSSTGYPMNSYTSLTAKKSRFGLYFEITDISPLRLDTIRDIHYNGFTYQFTPLTWCCRVKDNGDEGRDYVMADILYEYYIDATAFSKAN